MDEQCRHRPTFCSTTVRMCRNLRIVLAGESSQTKLGRVGSSSVTAYVSFAKRIMSQAFLESRLHPQQRNSILRCST